MIFRYAPICHIINVRPASKGTTLVTNNTREFAKVPGLLLDNWVEPD